MQRHLCLSLLTPDRANEVTIPAETSPEKFNPGQRKLLPVFYGFSTSVILSDKKVRVANRNRPEEVLLPLKEPALISGLLTKERKAIPFLALNETLLTLTD